MWNENQSNEPKNEEERDSDGSRLGSSTRDRQTVRLKQIRLQEDRTAFLRNLSNLSASRFDSQEEQEGAAQTLSCPSCDHEQKLPDPWGAFLLKIVEECPCCGSEYMVEWNGDETYSLKKADQQWQNEADTEVVKMIQNSVHDEENE